MNIQSKLAVAGVCSLFLITGQAHAEFFEDLEVELGVGYQSRHVEEGEEEFENGIYAAEIEVEKDFDDAEVFVELELLGGVTENFSEVEAVAGFNYPLTEDLTAALAYIWYHESPTEEGEGATGQELEGVLEYSGLEWADLDVGVLQSLDNGGDIWWLGVSKSFLWGDVEITPRVAAYYDAGYVSKEDDALNNLLYEVEAAWYVTDKMALVMNVAYSHAQENLTSGEEEEGEGDEEDDDDDDDEEGGQENPVWFGLFLEYEF